MRKIVSIFILLLISWATSAQSDFDKFRQQQKAQFSQFRSDKQAEFDAFRRQVNEQYAEFMERSWGNFETQPAVEQAKQPEIQPVVFQESQEATNHIEGVPDTKPIPVQTDVLVIPEAMPTPEPIAAVAPHTEIAHKMVSISFYGSLVSIGFPTEDKFHIEGLTEKQLAKAWKTLSGKEYDITLSTVLNARQQMRLCDWAYMKLLQQITEKHYGKTNEAVFAQVYLMTQSGYCVRMAAAEDKLYLLFASSYDICGMQYYRIEGQKFYSPTKAPKNLRICEAAYEKEKVISLQIADLPKLSEDPTQRRTLTSKKGLTASTSVNKNLIDFYDGYPRGYFGGDVTTQWVAYANTPTEQLVQERLYPTLRKNIQGLSEKDAVGLLLNWVQTAFPYEYDDQVWGGDRAFFPSETLYYPYSDCEDRAILFSRIIRDLLKLDVVLIYYPGHLAAAVAFKEQPAGDYITYKNRNYTVCDPTYINAGIGRTMPKMDNQQAKVIILK